MLNLCYSFHLETLLIRILALQILRNYMINLEINSFSSETIDQSIDDIAQELFRNFKLQVNESFYRLIDIEFYYYAEGLHEDIYAHQHQAQLESAKWYFHGSGIDITFGNGKHFGGMLIRAIAKVSPEGEKSRYFIEKEIHGPLNVKTEVCRNLNGVFEDAPNVFRLIDISRDRHGALMVEPEYLIKTRRIGLNPDKEITDKFFSKKHRFVIFPNLKLKNKTQIALDMKAMYPHLDNEAINKALGSKFL